MKKEPVRCPWCLGSPLMIEYHDTEWGKPVHEDDLHFEYIVLDSFQAGLSWSTILNKRENFRKAFAGFDAVKVSRFKDKHVERLMLDAGIIRNRLKILATISNAQAFLKVQKEYGSFDKYIWKFTNGKILPSKRNSAGDVPAKTKESDEMSKDLYSKGFKFVGSTICYAYMQAAGMVNDHLEECSFRK